MSKNSTVVKLPPTLLALVQGIVLFVLFYFINTIIFLFHYESEWWINITAITTLILYVLIAQGYNKIQRIGYIVFTSMSVFAQLYVYPDKIMAVFPPHVLSSVNVFELRQGMYYAALYFDDLKLHDHYPNYFLAELDEHPEADEKYTGEYIIPIVQKSYMEGDSIFAWAVGCNLEESSYKMSFKDDSLFHLSLERAPRSGITLIRNGKEYKRYLPFVRGCVEANHLKTIKNPVLVSLSENPEIIAENDRKYFFYIPALFIFTWAAFISVTYLLRKWILTT